ncbi:MAG: ADP-ribose pyrophosphatase [Candidatus Marinimicrobia bacterium]|nr:ADP-ribose pyrophosphatase [Candidatus Neomarinimicrobiota bacterium]
MSTLEEKKISSQKIFQGKLINLFLDHVKLPNGETSTREWVDHPGAVCVVPILPSGEICLIRQYRYGPKEEFIEIPAGKLDKEEKPLDCARRELSEEIGYVAKKLTFMTKIYPAIGFSNEIMWMYLGENLIKTERNLDQDEFLELAPVTIQQAFDWVKSGKIADVKTIIGILWVHQLMSGIK